MTDDLQNVEQADGPRAMDDFTVIRKIDRRLAQALHDLGVHSFAQVAAWDRTEVRRVRDALDLEKRIWRENWIEQAALHARRGAPDERTKRLADKEVGHAEPKENERPSKTEHPPIASAVPQLAAQPPLVAAAPAQAQKAKIVKVGRRSSRLPAPAMRRFVYIRGVSEELAEQLRAAGVRSIAEIAAWTRSDVKWFQAMLAPSARISADQWIEQATILARGSWTAHALRVVTGETRQLVPRPADRPEASLPKAEPPASQFRASILAPIMVSYAETAVPPPGTMRGRLLDHAIPARLGRSLKPKITWSQIKRPPPDLGRKELLAQTALSDLPASTSSPHHQGGPDANDVTAADENNESELGSEPLPLETVSLVDDWDDAEALVIRQAAPATDMVSPVVAVEPSTADVVESSNPPSVDRNIDADSDTAFWGDEADVVIVPRKSSREPLESAPADPVRAKPVSETSVSITPKARENVGYSPEFIADRMVDRYAYDDDGDETASVNFGVGLEEATVTIIRAEASEHAAASVMPGEAANDASSPSGSDKQPRFRSRMGARFLKALTGSDG